MSWQVYVLGLMLASLVIGAEAAYATREGTRGRRSALVTMFGIAALPVAIVLHNLTSAVIDGEETVSFIVGVVVAPAAITLGTSGLALALRRDRLVLAAGFAIFATGLAVFPLFFIALLVSAAAGSPIETTGAVEALLLPVSLIAVTAGLIVAAFALASDDAPASARLGA